VIVVLSLTNFSTWAGEDLYRLEPFTLQQSIHDAQGNVQAVTGRFVTMALPVMKRGSGLRYEHMLPTGHERPGPPIVLKVKPRFFFDRNAPFSHPFERPLSRILLYWGCGENPGKGQPQVIETAGFDDDQLARHLAQMVRSSMPGRHSAEKRGPDEAIAYHSAPLPKGAEMQGLHELHAGLKRTQFRVGGNGDFLEPITVSDAYLSDRGSATVRWQPVPGASAYFVNLYVHPSKSPVAVIWTSSRIPEMGFVLSEHHPGGAEVSRLRDEGVLMQADNRECTIPSAVTQYRDYAIAIQVHAFGTETVIAPESGGVAGPASAIHITPRATTTILLLNQGNAVKQHHVSRDF
jgi:hypothetical protein